MTVIEKSKLALLLYEVINQVFFYYYIYFRVVKFALLHFARTFGTCRCAEMTSFCTSHEAFLCKVRRAKFLLARLARANIFTHSGNVRILSFARKLCVIRACNITCYVPHLACYITCTNYAQFACEAQNKHVARVRKYICTCKTCE